MTLTVILSNSAHTADDPDSAHTADDPDSDSLAQYPNVTMPLFLMQDNKSLLLSIGCPNSMSSLLCKRCCSIPYSSSLLLFFPSLILSYL